MITRRTLIAALPLGFAACTLPDVSPSARTTVIMIRHADRAGEVLNSKGIARAAAMPAALARYDLDAIYAPDIQRNLDTAAPLATATGLPVTVIVKEQAGARMTADYPDGTVIWVGNKGNLRTIWAELGAPGQPPQEYGEIGVIELQGTGRHRVTRLTVGP
ncbi:histidine phosphatase family protein [Roseobacter ponti]|uniref:Histidine phosphatase family protein n=1 Tax=Roseobacter ponti TaxID=1891787 RepID=A0A858SQF5_9RHOB|nr:histidine phosphatase family protein [Roseobacter ponti]QJF50088.1 histidine phosphatase family protein [Roseobacter ponti]